MKKQTNVRIRTFAVIAVVLSLPLMVSAEVLFSGGPGDGRTGAPGEGSCTDCHSGSPDDGIVQIIGAPTFYVPDMTYSITVTLLDQDQSRWGFELTAKDDASNGAGTFTVTDPVNTQLSDNAAPNADYMKHTSAGTYDNTPNGPVTWQFDWTAPSTDVGDITFYVAGNAANSNNNTSGDNIYTSSAVSRLDAIPSISEAGLLILAALIVLTAVVLIRRRKRMAI